MANVKLKVVEFSDDSLGNNNPRHDPIDAEPEIIARLVAHERVANRRQASRRTGLVRLSVWLSLLTLPRRASTP